MSSVADSGRVCPGNALARLPARRQTRNDLVARQGHWDKAAADADSLAKAGGPSLLQAGWVDLRPLSGSGRGPDPFVNAPGQQFAEPFPAGRPRWYLSADDPNGYVPLDKRNTEAAHVAT